MFGTEAHVQDGSGSALHWLASPHFVMDLPPLRSTPHCIVVTRDLPWKTAIPARTPWLENDAVVFEYKRSSVGGGKALRAVGSAGGRRGGSAAAAPAPPEALPGFGGAQPSDHFAPCM